MNLDDLVLISIDDHVVEPPDMFLRHVPEKYKDQAPVVFTDEKGVDKWMYQGKQAGVSGLNAVVTLDRDGALSEARASTERWRSGAPRGPLDGVPVTIKEASDMRKGDRLDGHGPRHRRARA